MKTFTRIDDMWSDLLGELLTTGQTTASRVGTTKEVLGYQAQLTDLDSSFVMNPVRKLSPTYAMAEMLWYLSGTNVIDMLVPYAPSYVRFAEGNRAWGSYGYRWMNDPAFIEESQGSNAGQLLKAIELLRDKRETRQAVLTMWNAGDLIHAIVGDHADIPCTLTWQFIVRGTALHMIVTMRSNDAWLGFPYDVFVNTTIQRLVAMELGVHVGTYTHQVGSMHLYDRNAAQAIDATMPRALADAYGLSLKYSHSTQTEGWRENYNGSLTAAIQRSVLQERWVRENNMLSSDWFSDFAEVVGTSNPLWDAVILCASKWVPIQHTDIRSPLMREAYLAAR